MIKIALIGATGSIGKQTLDIVRADRDKLKIVVMSCAENVSSLVKYAEEFSCKNLGIYNADKYEELKRAAPPGTNVFCGDDALINFADADIVVDSVVGMVGLKTVIEALKRKKIVALANKESLVAGGEIVKKALEKGGEIRPVDSEHSAIWQSKRDDVNFKRIILTASGGPFYFNRDIDLSAITPEQAVKHPNWNMGAKVSIDSATMMNKALETIEARWLFDTTAIDYVIHPQSIVHSMVEYDDGSIISQSSFPDMRLPIRYALFGKHGVREYRPIDLPTRLEFYKPDETRFKAPALARAAIASGGTAPIILNAANEAAVRLFTERKIAFTDIVDIAETALSCEPVEAVETISDVFDTHNRIFDKIYCDKR